MLQVQGFVGGFVVSPLYGEGRGVDADLDGSRPVGVHLPVFMMVTFELQLEVRPAKATGPKKQRLAANYSGKEK